MVPDEGIEQVRAWADSKVPEHLRDEIRMEVDVGGRTLTIYECRPSWHPDMTEWTRTSVARLRYTKYLREWSLYWPDRNGEFHEYDLAEPSEEVKELLEEIDADPTGIFWG